MLALGYLPLMIFRINGYSRVSTKRLLILSYFVNRGLKNNDRLISGYYSSHSLHFLGLSMMGSSHLLLKYLR